MWSVWDKKTEINGFSAGYFLSRNKHLEGETVIYIKKTESGRTVQVEGKSILAKLYEIDPALPDDEFIAEYERIINAPPEEEPPGEVPSEEEETDTTTYTELAQVYREGVNSIE